MDARELLKSAPAMNWDSLLGIECRGDGGAVLVQTGLGVVEVACRRGGGPPHIITSEVTWRIVDLSEVGRRVLGNGFGMFPPSQRPAWLPWWCHWHGRCGCADAWGEPNIGDDSMQLAWLMLRTVAAYTHERLCVDLDEAMEREL